MTSPRPRRGFLVATGHDVCVWSATFPLDRPAVTPPPRAVHQLQTFPRAASPPPPPMTACGGAHGSPSKALAEPRLSPNYYVVRRRDSTMVADHARAPCHRPAGPEAVRPCYERAGEGAVAGQDHR